jgi:hypothetical protein
MKELEQGVYLITHKERNEQYIVILRGIAPLLRITNMINLTNFIYSGDICVMQNPILISLQHTDYEWIKLDKVNFPSFTECITDPINNISKKIREDIIERSRNGLSVKEELELSCKYYLPTYVINKIIDDNKNKQANTKSMRE